MSLPTASVRPWKQFGRRFLAIAGSCGLAVAPLTAMAPAAHSVPASPAARTTPRATWARSGIAVRETGSYGVNRALVLVGRAKGA